MPKHGGARNRSGPQKDPKSERSDKLGVRFARLPAGGFKGRRPAWPLTTPTNARERKVWEWAWRTPQAAAWISEPWRHRTVALWCRWSVRMENDDAAAAVATTVVRLADQIGLTPAGLKENGWEIEEIPGARALADGAPPAAGDQGKVPEPPAAVPLRDRLRVVTNAGG